jgi:hypothetical protein
MVAIVASTDMAFLPQVIIAPRISFGLFHQRQFRTRLEQCRSWLIQQSMKTINDVLLGRMATGQGRDNGFLYLVLILLQYQYTISEAVNFR